MLELSILISFGSVIMLFAVYKTQQLTNLRFNNKYQKTWNILKYFMIVFFIGYIIILVSVLSGDSRIIQSITGVIFFFGALFVYLTVRTGFNTIDDLHHTTVSKKYVDSIVNSMADTLIVIKVGSDLRISKVNQATLNLLGYEEAELINHPIKKLFGTDKKLKNYLGALGTELWLTNEEAYYYTKAGKKIPVLLSISCIRDSNNKIQELIIAAQDITQRIKSEKALKTSEQKYRRLSKELNDSNSMKELLFDVISHDLKNPAGVVKGFAEIGIENDPDNEILQEIRIGIENLLKVISNATAISKVAAGDEIDKESVDITEIIKTISKEFVYQLQDKKMELDLNLKKEIIVKANPIISEIFRNYIGNAIKYASSGQKIIVDANQENGIVNINIIDHGDTISKSEQKNIFKRSIQLGNTSGSGLGLAIVNRIAKAHNAEVGVKPNSPKGNIFYLNIPVQ